MTEELAQSRLTAALLTPVGRGAVATIRVEGDLSFLDRASEPLFDAANGRPLSEQPLERIAFGAWGRSNWTAGEEVVVCRVTPSALEIHCHGGDAAVRRIQSDLQQVGCDVVDWREQLEATTDSLESEFAEKLSRATTWRTADLLNEQASGLLRNRLEELIRSLTESEKGETNQSTMTAVRSQLDELLSWAQFGLHLSQPWNVVLTGRPNVGKSSLINALLGYQRAIVFDQPGTTRDVVTAETAFDGWPVLLADTAGLRETTEELEAAGIALARQQLQHADARLVLVDLSQPATPEDQALIDEWPDAIVIGHKCDLGDRWQSALPSSAIRASSVTGEGLETVQQRLAQQLVPRVPPPGTPVPISQRQIELLETARTKLIALLQSGTISQE